MNKLFLLIIISCISMANTALGYEIVVVKSSLSKINEQLQHTFALEVDKHPLFLGLKSIQPNQIKEIVIARGEKKEESALKIRNSRPDLILALGARALEASMSVPGIPIVHLLVIDAEKIIGDAPRVSGISLTVPTKVQLDAVTRYLPLVKRIGLVYDPKRSGTIIEQFTTARPDLQFISLAAHNTTEVPGLINSLRGKIDLLWMLPDLTTTNQKTIESYFLFSIRNKIPLLTFSEKFLKHGATIAVTFDIDGMAAQAAELAMDMLSGQNAGTRAAVSVPRVKTIINHKIAAKLNISVAGKGQTND